MDGNKNTTYQNLWDTGNIMVQRKFRAENAYIKKEPCKTRKNKLNKSH